jgi:hypothetical protein
MDTWSQPLLRACQGRTRLLALPNRNIPPLRAVALCVGHPHIPVSEQRPRTHLESTLAQRLSRELRAKGTTRGEYEQRRYAHRQRARLTLPHSACVAIASRCAHRAGSAQPPPAIGGVYVRGHPSMTHLWQIASQHAVVERRAAAFWRSGSQFDRDEAAAGEAGEVATWVHTRGYALLATPAQCHSHPLAPPPDMSQRTRC